MEKQLVVTKNLTLETLETVYAMNIGDGFAYLWKQLMSIPMSSLVYLICLLIGLKILFAVLKHFGVMKKD
jgi:hypothetical protein